MTAMSGGRCGRSLVVCVCVLALALVGATSSRAQESDESSGSKSAEGKRYQVTHGPCDLDERPSGSSAQWTPLGKAMVHRVGKGQGLRDIANAYGFGGEDGFRKLFDANPQLDQLELRSAGSTIRIPTCGTWLERRLLPPPPPEPEPEPEPEPKPEPEAQPEPEPEPEAAADPEPEPEAAPAVSNGSVWDSLAQCESGGNWSTNTGNGYYGGLQFSQATWQAVGGSGYPHENSREEQIKRGQILQSRSGWGQWPHCSAKLGLG